jgi:hypothetical protein
MTKEKSVLICYPVAAGEPPAESFVDTCNECRRAVWRAFSSPKDIDIVLCAACAEKEIVAARARGAPVKFEPPTKEQIEEVKWWFMNFGAAKES